MTTEPKRNRAQCAGCLAMIESRHRHDFQRCPCGAIAVDGGNVYQRQIGSIELFRVVSPETK